MPFPRRRAYHVIYDSSLPDALQYARTHDWNGLAVDFGVPSTSPHLLSTDMRTQLHAMAEELSIEWGYHAPGDDVSLFATYPPIRKAILAYFKDIIDLARDLSPSGASVVVHTGKPPSFRKARAEHDDHVLNLRNYYTSILLENLNELMAYGHPDVSIAAENHGWSPLAREVISSLLPRGLRLCLDIPKLVRDGQIVEEDLALFRSNLDSVEVVHVHDLHPALGSHQVVGEGMIDFSPFLDILSDIPRNPQYVFEVRPRELAHESLVNFGRLLEERGIVL